MKRAVIATLVCLGTVAVGALAVGREARAEEGVCGLPTTRPLWIDFSDGSVGFRNTVFGKPGLVLASSGTGVPRQLRSLGAQTVYWQMRLRDLVGTPTAPADPATVADATNALFDRAAASSGCSTPLIALNELFGASEPTPWTPENTQYRADVLTLLQTIAARGGHAFLLIPGQTGGPRGPSTAGEAAAWWQQAAEVADLVREVHFNALFISKTGPFLGSRRRRLAMRAAIAQFTAIGIPPERLGLQVGFQSGLGKGGREGLEPTEAWLEIVKLEALAVRQVAADDGIGSIWSWGWGTFGPGTEDPEKPTAACVYLWTREQGLCDGPAAAGQNFDTSLTEGQIILPDGAQCAFKGGSIETAALDELQALTSERGRALTALLERSLEGPAAPVSQEDVAHAEQIVLSAFGGDPSVYQAALAAKAVSEELAQSILADQLRRQTLAAELQLENPSQTLGQWAKSQQETVLDTATCLRDELPTEGSVDLSDYVPFLKLPPPSVTLVPEKPEIAYGGRTTVSGTVRSDRAAEVVSIYAKPFGADSFKKIGSVKVDDQGTWSFPLRPAIGTTYRALSKSAISEPVDVRVAPLVALSARTDRLVVRVQPARPGAGVALQRWSQASGRWVWVAKATLKAKSSAAFAWKPAPGTYRLRAYLPQKQAGPGFAAGSSPPVVYRASG